MARVTNIGEDTRYWSALTNTETGRTLQLDPGESAETDLPDGFSDPNLEIDGQPSVAAVPEVASPLMGTAFPDVTIPDAPADAGV